MNTDGLVRRVNKLELHSKSTDIDLVAELESARRGVERGEQAEPTNWNKRVSDYETRLSGNLSSSERELTVQLLNASKRMAAATR